MGFVINRNPLRRYRLAEIINSNLSEKFRPCPRFLYLSYFHVKDIETAGFFDFVERAFSSWYGENEPNPDMVQFFCDLENTILLPMTKLANFCVPIAVEKPKLEDMIISIEVIKRFEEQHHFIEKKGNVISLVNHQERRAEQEKDSDTPSETNIEGVSKIEDCLGCQALLAMTLWSGREAFFKVFDIRVFSYLPSFV